jgi:O-acetyl-ADP-ribose deacetylase (regulator of RNase III)
MALVKEKGHRSVAFPLIGAGSGGGREAQVQAWMADELAQIDYDGDVRVVRYRAQVLTRPV